MAGLLTYSPLRPSQYYPDKSGKSVTLGFKGDNELTAAGTVQVLHPFPY